MAYPGYNRLFGAGGWGVLACALGLSLLWLPAGLAAQTNSPAATYDEISAYQEQHLEGWQVLVNRKLLADTALSSDTLALLDRQLAQIAGAVPEKALGKLREVPIWVEHSSGQFPCMCYHESRGWLQTHAVNPAKTGAVELANPTNFLTWVRDQPWMVLHELAHAYHLRFLGENYEGIHRSYEHAKAARLYESVLRNNGHHERAYALSNPKEYFAETTEAFFGTNDFFPFVRPELRDYDPQMFVVLCDAWGVSNAGNHDPPAVPNPAQSRHTFSIGTNAFLLDGKPFQIRCGEMHAPRVPREYWRHRLQMARAMGLNAVCAYLFWNQVEPKPGVFDWSGQGDAAEFCRLAQETGLWVILRPGPYSCAEWEMGGLPWWLLKQADSDLRTRDPRFLAPARNYLKEVGRGLGPLQVTKGGPILMVQVENEYGSFGKDAEYMGDLRRILVDSGFDVPLFCCDPPEDLKNGFRDDIFPVVNFGKDPAGGFRKLREILPQGPLMCGEFYPGWFDTWGVAHHTGKLDTYLADLTAMLQSGASFSIYMVHGGTTFGLWSGADRPFKPDTSSYDYDAPISEAGWPTEKFYRTRELFSKFLAPGETLPEPPAKNPVISFHPIETQECAPLFNNLPKPASSQQPHPMEYYNQGYGWILYRTRLAAGPAMTLEPEALHDFGFVFLDGERVGVLDRRSASCSIRLPVRSRRARLDILVEPMGRINFGPQIADHKGLFCPMRLHQDAGPTNMLLGWQVFSMPLDAHELSGLHFTRARARGPAFWRAFINLETPGDTFLDMRPWGKGVVWVNGHCLGRYWNIGPTQTMYVPGVWLKQGRNEIIIADLLGPEKPVVAGLDKPILDQLRPQLDFARTDRAGH